MLNATGAASTQAVPTGGAASNSPAPADQLPEAPFEASRSGSNNKDLQLEHLKAEVAKLRRRRYIASANRWSPTAENDIAEQNVLIENTPEDRKKDADGDEVPHRATQPDGAPPEIRPAAKKARKGENPSTKEPCVDSDVADNQAFKIGLGE